MLVLEIKFSFDHTSGMFFGELPSGARFAIAPNSISGKLGANLALFRAACEAERKEEPFMPIVGCIAPKYDEDKVRKFSERGKLKIELEELEL